MSFIGLDIGTTGCKVICFNEQGKIISQTSREYTIETPRPGWAEQDGEKVWQLVWDALKETVNGARRDPPKAMALSVQGEAVTAVDSDGKSLRPMMLGMDLRTTIENNWLIEHFGRENLFQRTGMPVHTINTLPKLMWIKKHDPQLFDKTEQFLLYEDFFIHHLTGEATISHCLASRTQMYALEKSDWAEEILIDCGLEKTRLAKLAPKEGGIVGLLRKKMAEELQIPNEVLLVSGGHDQACAALGSGVISNGSAMVSTGTAEVVEVVMDQPKLNQELQESGISIYKHVVPNMFLAMTLNHSGGLILRWFRDEFGQYEKQVAKNKQLDAYDVLLADVSEEPTHLMVLPHFSGSGTPILDTSSKGAILGLTFTTTKSTLAKGLLEGLTFELKLNLDLLKKCTIDIKNLHAVGGGAKSRLWLQLKANICDIPLNIPMVTEAACLGAAMLAATSAGTFSNLKEAAESWIDFDRTILPQSPMVKKYLDRYQIYQKIYPAIRDLQRIL
jgi:xylulokinase